MKYNIEKIRRFDRFLQTGKCYLVILLNLKLPSLFISIVVLRLYCNEGISSIGKSFIRDNFELLNGWSFIEHL